MCHYQLISQNRLTDKSAKLKKSSKINNISPKKKIKQELKTSISKLPKNKKYKLRIFL